MVQGMLHGAVPTPTRFVLFAVSLTEMVAGAMGIAGAWILAGSRDPNIIGIAIGVFFPLSLLVPGGGAILLHNRWSYLLHCLVFPVALVGASTFLFVFMGPAKGLPVLVSTTVASVMVELFFRTVDVRRWFNV